MNKKKILFFLILVISILYFINLATPIVIDFLSGGNNENMTFSGNQNTTRYLNISIYANVTSAYINISTGNTQGQYYSNLTEDGLSSSYINTGVFWGPEYMVDGLWSTTSAYTSNGSQDTVNLTVNYVIPNYTINATFMVRGDACSHSGIGTSHIYYYCINISSKNPILVQDISDSTIPIECYVNTTGYIPSACFDSGNNLTIIVNQWFPSSSSNGIAIYEESVTFNVNNETYNPWLEVGTIDGIREWNYSGLFNVTDNKTNDLSVEINTALNNGICDCTGCSKSNNNCSISFLFHSDNRGIIRYSAVNITYETFPFTSLVSPANASFSSVTKSLECNATNFGGALSNITLYVWRSNNSLYNDIATNYSNITGTSNSSKWNVTFDSTDTYHWSCISRTNISYYDWADTNNTLIVDISVPVTTLNSPANNSWKNTGSIDFNCTTDVTNPSGSFLYGDFNSSYSLNQTNGLVVSGVQYTFKLNLTDKVGYSWACAANKSTDSTIVFSQYGNYSLNIDTVQPTTQIISITPVAGSTTFSFNSSANDSNTYNCKYSIYNGAVIDGTNENLSFTCNSVSSATVTGYGTYQLFTYVTDPAGNEATDSVFFTVSSAPSAPPGGGGGGGVAEKANLSWSILTDRGSTNYVIVMLPGSTESRDVVLTNKASQALNFVMSCRYVESKMNNQSLKAPDACEYVTISNRTVSLPAAKNAQRLDTFTVSVPDDYPIGDHTFNIVATDGNNKQNYVTVTIKVGELGVFGNLYYKLTSSKPIDPTGIIPGSRSFGFPYIIIFVLAFFVSLIGLSLLLSVAMPRGPTKTAVVFLLSIVASLVAVMAL